MLLDRPKHKPNTSKEWDKQNAKSKLLPKSTGPYCVTREYTYVIVIYQADAELPVSVYRCSKAPAENKNHDNYNLYSDYTNPGFPLPHPIVNKTLFPFPKNAPTTIPKPPLLISHSHSPSRTRSQIKVSSRSHPGQNSDTPFFPR